MKHSQQQGVSTIVILIILGIIGVGAYIGIQYIPHVIESGTVDTVMTNLEEAHAKNKFTDVAQIKKQIARLLDVNDAPELKDAFSFSQSNEGIVVSVSYERELNLLYTKKIIPYGKSVRLN